MKPPNLLLPWVHKCPIVNHYMRELEQTEGSLFQIRLLSACIAALAERNEALMVEHLKLQSIAPKRLRFEDGSVYTYHTPDHLIPETPCKGTPAVQK